MNKIVKILLLFFTCLTFFIKCDTDRNIPINIPEKANVQLEFAANQLSEHLSKVYPNYSFPITRGQKDTRNSIQIKIENKDEKDRINTVSESFSVSNEEGTGYIVGTDELGVLFGVYALLEELGYGFFISGDTKPKSKEVFSWNDWNIAENPTTRTRINLNWHNFLSGCTGWDLEHWKKWMLQSAKLRFNTIMIHAYGNNPMEVFNYNGIDKATGYLTSTVKGRDWGAEHVNDVRRLTGGEIFDEPVFGSTAALVLDENRNESAIKLMQEVFQYAEQIGLKIIYAIDIDTHSSNPQNIINSLQGDAKLTTRGGFVVANPDSEEGYAFYKKRIQTLLDTYPEIDEIAFWKRRVKYKTPWKDFKYIDFLENWKKEFNEKLLNNPEIRGDEFSESTFLMNKLIETYRKAIEELGHNIEYSCGSWDFPFMKTADVFLQRDIALIPLDYKVAFENDEIVSMLANIGSHRDMYPIVWAHHDDHRYLGKPYTPWENFSDLLNKSNSSGFGIIHWKTRPLDLYFTSLSRQTWSDSENENLAASASYFVKKNFGESQKGLNEYLNKWIKDAPMFGRETSDSFFDYGEFIIGEHPIDPKIQLTNTQKRIHLLENVDATALNDEGKEMLKYFYGMENFFVSIINNQQVITNAQIAVNKGDFETARKLVQNLNPEKAVEDYIKFTSYGNRSRGEEAMVISLNLRWIPDVLELKQLTGLAPVRYKFQPTSHDSLAQWPGSYTYFIDKNNSYWYGLGEKEISGNKIVSQKQILADITDAHLLLKKTLSLPIKIRKFNISKGKYKIIIYTENDLEAKLKCSINSKNESLIYGEYEINNGKVSFDFTNNTEDVIKLNIFTKKELKIYGVEIIPLR